MTRTSKQVPTGPAHLNPTDSRLRVMAAIINGRVYGYDWTGRIWADIRNPAGAVIDTQVVTRWANDLLRHRLAVKPKPKVRSDKIWLRPTDAGRAWRAKHAGVEAIQPEAGVL